MALPQPILPPRIARQVGLRSARALPLSTVTTVLRDLGEFEIDAADVAELLEQRILLGFNIAVSLSKRAEYRVLTESIAHFRRSSGRSYHALQWPEIFPLIIPQVKPTLTGLEIRHALLCDRGHVENLIRARELKTVKPSKPGPGGSCVVGRNHFESWLKSRMQ